MVRFRTSGSYRLSLSWSCISIRGQTSRGVAPPPRCGLGWRNRRCGRGLKKIHQWIRFLGYMFAKNRSIWNLAWQMPRHSSATYIPVFEPSKNWLKEKLHKDFSLTFGVKNHFWENSRSLFSRTLFFHVLQCFSFACCVKSLFLVIFRTFINFRPNMAWHLIT